MANHRKKDVLTTGQVAQICNVAPRTVSKWFDSGQLRGYRIPGSKDRRIPVDQLLRFMKAHGIPTAGLGLGTVGVLILDGDLEMGRVLREALAADGTCDATIATSAFEAGVLAEKTKPQVIVIDVSTLQGDTADICRTLRASDGLSDAKLIATGASLTEGQGQGLVQDGFAAYLRKPFDIRQLLAAIKKVTQ